MEKFIIPPEQDSYTVEDGSETVSVILDGGLSRSRRDILNASSLVSVQWSFDPEQYQYFRAFYRGITGKGAEPFLIDLLLDLPTLTEHECKFVIGSVRLSRQRGLEFEVSAQLEAKPAPADDEYDYAYAMLYGLYGIEESILLFNELEYLVDVVMPDAFV